MENGGYLMFLLISRSYQVPLLCKHKLASHFSEVKCHLKGYSTFKTYNI